MAYMRAASNFPAAYVMNSFADLCFTTYLCQFKFDNFAAVQWVGTHATRGPGQKLSNTARCEISTRLSNNGFGPASSLVIRGVKLLSLAPKTL